MITKGEWKAEIGYKDCYIVCRSNSGITGIATVHAKNPMNPANGTVEANAHLIAAAPELYEALKECLRITHNEGIGLIKITGKEDGTNRVVFTPEQLNRIGELTRKALAKAEGK